MDTFFHPSSIAVVGASNRKGGSQIVGNLLYGFKGPIYPINPKHKEIQGLPCFPSLEDIPHHVDMAIIFVPAPAIPSVLEACARKGVLRVMIQSAGFAEIGDKGEVIQDRCTAIAKEAGIRIWGPNCMGLVDVPGKLFYSFMHPRIYEDGLIPGRISLVVQSGMLSAGFLTDLMSRRRIGVGKVCSIGNKMDVDECDLLEYLIKDPETDAVALYLESIPRGRLFAEIAARSTKPVVVLKGGKSEAGARAAKSHTFSLSGNSRLLDGVLQMCGVTLARDFHQMIDLAMALAVIPRAPSPCRTAIITISGGAGILSCDLLEAHGLKIAELSEKTKKALGRIFPDWMPTANPIDIYPAVELHGRLPVYNETIDILLEEPNVDALLVHHLAGLEDEFLDLDTLKEKVDRSGKSLLFWVFGRGEATGSFRREAQRCGFSVYGEISSAAECLSAAACYHHRQKLRSAAAGEISPLPENEPQKFDLTPSEGPVWDEHDSKRLLAEWHIPVVEEKLVGSLTEARKEALKLGYPVVLKGLLPGEVHKTESGLVHVGIADLPQLEDTYRKVQKKMADQGRIILQQQVDIDYELIAGFLRDAQFGPCIMFGVGGIFSELEPDVVFALAPLKQSEAVELMRGIRKKQLLNGFRGIAPLREELMASILINLGNLGRSNPHIEQIDINPVAVTAGSPLALDATVILKSEKPHQEKG